MTTEKKTWVERFPKPEGERPPKPEGKRPERQGKYESPEFSAYVKASNAYDAALKAHNDYGFAMRKHNVAAGLDAIRAKGDDTTAIEALCYVLGLEYLEGRLSDKGILGIFG